MCHSFFKKSSFNTHTGWAGKCAYFHLPETKSEFIVFDVIENLFYIRVLNILLLLVSIGDFILISFSTFNF